MNNNWDDEPPDEPWNDPIKRTLAWALIVAIEMYWVLYSCVEYLIWFVIGFFKGSK